MVMTIYFQSFLRAECARCSLEKNSLPSYLSAFSHRPLRLSYRRRSYLANSTVFLSIKKRVDPGRKSTRFI